MRVHKDSDDGDMTIGRPCQRGTLPRSSRASILAPHSTRNSTTSVPAAAAACRAVNPRVSVVVAPRARASKIKSKRAGQ